MTVARKLHLMLASTCLTCLMLLALGTTLSGCRCGHTISDEHRAARALMGYAVTWGYYPESLSVIHEDFRRLDTLVYETNGHSYYLMAFADVASVRTLCLDELIRLGKDEGIEGIIAYLATELDDLRDKPGWIRFDVFHPEGRRESELQADPLNSRTFHFSSLAGGGSVTPDTYHESGTGAGGGLGLLPVDMGGEYLAPIYRPFGGN